MSIEQLHVILLSTTIYTGAPGILEAAHTHVQGLDVEKNHVDGEEVAEVNVIVTIDKASLQSNLRELLEVDAARRYRERLFIVIHVMLQITNEC